MALGLTQPLVKMSTRNIPGGKGGRCMRLTTSPPSRAECHEIWEPKPPGTLWAAPGLLRDCFTFFFNVWNYYKSWWHISVTHTLQMYYRRTPFVQLNTLPTLYASEKITKHQRHGSGLNMSAQVHILAKRVCSKAWEETKLSPVQV
jgi:hypothetical protein